MRAISSYILPWGVFFFLFTLSSAAFAQSQPDQGSPLDSTRLHPSLIQKAREHGAIPVIVTLKTRQPGNTTSSNPGIAGRDARSRAQSEIIQHLPSAANASEAQMGIKRFTTVDALGLLAKEGDLLALSIDPNVDEIVEDIPHPPFLRDTLPLIGSDPDYTFQGYSGDGQVVAVIDTGADKYHEFLDGKIVSEACFGSNIPSLGATSLCPGQETESTEPDSGLDCPVEISGCGHGTFVAGIAAGVQSGRSGVAGSAGIIAINIFSKFTDSYCTAYGFSSPCVLSYTSDYIRALEHVYSLRDEFTIAAINMSLGGGDNAIECDWEPAREIIESLADVGIATIAASGNSGLVAAISSPACISRVVSVGSTTKDDKVSNWSNSSDFLDLLAPGEAIVSSFPGGFAQASGTSFAAPHVAGAMAVLRSRAPSADVNSIVDALIEHGTNIQDTRIGASNRIKPRIQLDAVLDATYSVSYQSDAHGSIIGNTQQMIRFGEDADPVQAEPSPGYRLENWSDGLLTLERQDRDVAHDIEVSASFSLNDSNSLHVVSGNNQSALFAGDLVEPLVVGIRSEHGEPVKGVLVFWQAESGAQVQPETSVSDDDGTAHTNVTLSANIGYHTFSASAYSEDGTPLENSPIEFKAYSFPDDSVSARLYGPSSATAGDEVEIDVQIEDADGNRIAQPLLVCVSTAYADTPSPPLLSPLEMSEPATGPDNRLCGTTDDNGEARFSLKAITSGSIQVIAQLVGFSEMDSIAIDFEAAAPDHIIMRPSLSALDACDTAKVEIFVSDSFGNPVETALESQVQVSISLIASSGSPAILDSTLENATQTDPQNIQGLMPSEGRATIRVTHNMAGGIQMVWSSGDLPADNKGSEPLTILFNVGPFDPVNSKLVSKDSWVYSYGGRLPVSVIPKDSCGLRLGSGLDLALETSFGRLTSVQDMQDGTYSALFSADAGECPDEPAIIEGYVSGIRVDNPLEIEVLCAEASSNSLVWIDPDYRSVMACPSKGVFSRIHVIPLDSQGNPLAPGQRIRVVEEPSYLAAGAIEQYTDPDSGVSEYILEVGSNRCSMAVDQEVRIRVGDVELETRPSVEFLCPPVADNGVAFSAQPKEVNADGKTPAIVEVSLTDTCGNPAFGRSMSVDVMGTLPATIEPPEPTTNDSFGDSSDGVAQIHAFSKEPGLMGIAVTIEQRFYESADNLVVFVEATRRPRILEPRNGDTLRYQPTFIGSGEPSNFVILTVDNTIREEIEVDEEGRWSWTPTKDLAYGRRLVTLRDHDGRRGHSIEIEIMSQSQGSIGGCACSSSMDKQDIHGASFLVFLLLLASGLRFSKRVSNSWLP